MPVATPATPPVATSRVRRAATALPPPYRFAEMEGDPHALDRLDIQFRWGRFTVRVLRCHLTSFPPGMTVPAHMHREYEFHFIPRGAGSVTLDSGTFSLRAGLWYLTGPNVAHRQDAGAHDAMDELCLHVDITPDLRGGDDERVERGAEDSWEAREAEACVARLNALPAWPIPDRHDAMHEFLVAYRAWRDGEFGAYTTIRHAVTQMLLRAVRAHDTLHDAPTLPARDMDAHRFELATRYMRDNYARPLTLGEVARSLNISVRHLQRVLEAQGGETFTGYLERYRLAQVCAALAQGGWTIEELAARHGFSSGRYLHYVFKRRLGVTPARYRLAPAPAARS